MLTSKKDVPSLPTTALCSVPLGLVLISTGTNGQCSPREKNCSLSETRVSDISNPDSKLSTEKENTEKRKSSLSLTENQLYSLKNELD